MSYEPCGAGPIRSHLLPFACATSWHSITLRDGVLTGPGRPLHAYHRATGHTDHCVGRHRAGRDAAIADGSAGGEDPQGLLRIWSVKPKFAVGGARSCAELLIVDQLIREGWGAVGVRVRARGNCGWLGSRRPDFGPWPMPARRRCCGGLRAAASRRRYAAAGALASALGGPAGADPTP
jgi:hypothetical protein